MEEKKNALLTMNGISKAYPGVQALQDVDFELRRGEVHALLGENGAGKSTLIKVLMGIVEKDTGLILLDGMPVKIRNAYEARTAGIAAVFQELSQIPTLTVGENIFLKDEYTRSRVFLNRNKIFYEADRMLSENRIKIGSHTLLSELSQAQRQLVEIMKATASRPKILILDEPTSALTEGEAELLFAIVRRLKAQGTGIIYITHRMKEVWQVADRITILRDGENVAAFDDGKVGLQIIVNKMVGREVELYDDEMHKETAPGGKDPVLEVKNLNHGESFRDISFTLYRGEILGVAGLVGSGRSELMQLLFGIEKADSGDIIVEGRPVEIRRVRDALNSGIAMVPENRHQQGLVLMHSVENNISLPVLKHFSSKGFLQKKKMRTWVDGWIEKLSIKTESRKKIVNTLSGGNQQKVVIAKWLGIAPRVLIVDEPTAGIDVHSKAEIHRIMRELTREGISIIMISSEMPELLAHSDRVMVMNNNKLITILDEADQEKIMSLIVHDNVEG